MIRTLIAAFAIVAAVAAAASPVAGQAPPTGEPRFFSGEITAGSIAGFLNGIEIAAQYDLAGPGFHIVGVAGDVGRMAGANPCAPAYEHVCMPGDEVSLSSFFTGSAIEGILIARARVTVNGETLEPAIVAGSAFTLEADPVTVPRGNRRNLVLSTPFTLMSGFPVPPGDTVVELRVYPEGESTAGEPWAVGHLSGNGIVTGIYERERIHVPGYRGVFLYVLRSIIYSFNAQ